MSNKSKDSYHHGDLKKALIDAGIALLKERGVAAISLREVAKRAGVSHTAPYRHFKDKNALLYALAAVGFQQLADAMQQSIDAHPEDGLQQLLSAGQSYVRLAVDNPEITNLMFGGVLDCEHRPAELSEISQSAFNGLLRIIENGKQMNLYRDEDSLSLALAVWSSVHGLSMLISAGELGNQIRNDTDIVHVTNLLNNLLLEGIKNRN